jgi:hypothetical protein
MDVITKFLDKYSYRFPKGYPDLTDPADKKLMQELLSEIGIGEAAETDTGSAFAARKPKNETKTYKQILRDAGLSEKILNQIEKKYNELVEANPKYPDVFDSIFRKNTIEQVKDTFNNFSQYVDIHDKGLGRGEVATIMGTADITSGGTANKDIIDSDGNEYDVKELTDNGEFRTASGGYITTTKFKKNLDYLISLFYQLRGDEENKTSTGSSKLDNAIDDILKYYQGGYKTGGISGGTFTKLEAVCNSLKTADLSSETQPYQIKIGNKKFAIDKETHDKIQNGEPINNIKLGDPISGKSSLLTKLKSHPWVENYELIRDDLSVIWNDFLKNIKGLIIVDPKTLEPTLYKSEELKEKFAPYRVVQNQINVKAKDKIKENLDEDEDLENEI